ncbi:MAG: ral nucleoside transport system ATP-binding protein [Myxococcales bacterium]|nr:ral nucleoside transport system ATP-binding protein [Myxococcales bacterium]
MGVSVRYGDCVAVRPSSVNFRSGLIHAVCGENGAGKSTLLKIVAGMVVPDTGHVDAFGSRLGPHTPREAISRGIGMVLQHFALVPVFTALENIVLGAEAVSAFGILDIPTARRRAEAVAKDLGVDLHLDATVASLGVGDRQRLEIARALYRNAKLLILDEPTAVLTKGEVEALYATLRRLADGGTGVVVVTHKMDEVRDYADEVTVMRRGEVLFTRTLDRSARDRSDGDRSAGDGGADAGSSTTLDGQIEEVTAAIMGAGRATTAAASASATSVASAAREEAGADDVVLELKGVSLGRELEDVSFALHAGEIVGVAGVEGNGQRELVAVLARDSAPDRGEVKGAMPAVIREDRQLEGLVLDATLRDNIVLGELRSFTGALGLLDLHALEAEALTRIARSGAPPDLDRPARSLSGGNQQKIVVARALARLGKTRTRALVAAQPTRGVDLGATEDIHGRLRQAAANGAGVLVLSADLAELRALCSRILVLARGRVVADLPPTTSDAELGRRMLGIEESS